MKKRILALTMAGALTLGLLAGCGGSSTPTSTPASDPTQGAEQTGTPAVGPVTLKVGGIGPLTGDLAQYGLATQRGAQIAVDEINALGGALQLEYDFQDDTGVNDTAVSAYNTLKDWGAMVIYGCTTTGPCVVVASETYADRYFQLTPSASSPDVTADKDNAFQMCFTDPGQGVAAANYLRDHDLGTKIGVIYNNGDAYSTGIAEAFLTQAAEVGLNVVATQTYPSDKNTDYTVQINACKDAGADLLFLPIYYTPASLILAQAKQMNYAPTFFGADGMDGMLTMEGFDASLAEGLMLMTPFNASGTDERTVNFVAKYQSAYGEVPNQFAADGYDCMYAIYEACQKTEGLVDMVASENHEALCDALIGVFTSGDFSVDGLTGSGMSWLTSGEVSKEPVVVVVKDGVYVNM